MFFVHTEAPLGRGPPDHELREDLRQHPSMTHVLSIQNTLLFLSQIFVELRNCPRYSNKQNRHYLRSHWTYTMAKYIYIKKRNYKDARVCSLPSACNPCPSGLNKITTYPQCQSLQHTLLPPGPPDPPRLRLSLPRPSFSTMELQILQFSPTVGIPKSTQVLSKGKKRKQQQRLSVSQNLPFLGICN